MFVLVWFIDENSFYVLNTHTESAFEKFLNMMLRFYDFVNSQTAKCLKDVYLKGIFQDKISESKCWNCSTLL